MNYIFTICSNNYLAQAIVLGRSIKQHEPESKFILFLCDKKSHTIEYTDIADEVIEISCIEPYLTDLIRKYDVIELNTAIKPRAAQYLFEERHAEKVIYLDPDIKLFKSLKSIYCTLDSYSIVLSPHIYTPIPIDGKRPGENVFLNYGLYNLGFIGLKNDTETLKMLTWWKNRTYQEGYINVKDGLFVDQLPMNHVPIFFKQVYICQDFGVNMAPWNLHERTLSKKKHNTYVVNDLDDLVFFHFSAINVSELELSLIHYGRFSLFERQDLLQLYKDYQQELIDNKYFFFRDITPFYIQERNAYLKKKKVWYKKIFSR
jgi:hypothetical protein